MPTDAWSLDSPMFPPLVLRPPHGPRLVRLLVMILAVLFYLPPAGWSPITNGPEGELASAAQDLLNHGGWTVPNSVSLLHGPLALWLTRISFSFLGVNEFAARLPSALGVVAMVWVVLRMGEHFGNLWRGFVAALVLICSPGMFSLGRILTPYPITSALLAATVYALQRGSECRPTRRRWLALAWIAFGLSTLAGGWLAGGIPAFAVLLLVLFYGEARLRFRALISWEGALIFSLTLAIMTASGFPLGGSAGAAPELTLPAWQLLCWQLGLLFPWSFLLLPCLVQLCGRHPLEWDEGLPLAWLAAGFLIAMADPVLFSPLLFWPAFAVWGAQGLKTMHRRMFLWGCAPTAAAACGGLYLAQHLRGFLGWLFPAASQSIAAIPDFFWPAVTPVAFIAMLAFLLFVGAAFWAEIFQNRRFALLSLFAAMIPAGFAFADIGAKFAPYFSDAAVAGFIDSNREAHPVLFVDASRFETSSLRFYLSKASQQNTRPCPRDFTAAWKAPAALVTSRSRLPHWQHILGENYKIARDSGEHLLLVTQEP